METIALVFMAEDTDNFFIEGPPPRPPESWIHLFVSDITKVEHVQVFQIGAMVSSWSNPNVSPK